VRRPPQLVRVAGRQVAVEDAGPAQGFPVIVHHGGTRHLFPGAVRDARAHGVRLISYDRPGQTVGLFADDADRLLDAVSAGSTRIVVGVGDESTPQQMVYQTAHALAEKLGGQPARFPGGHGGFGSHPDGFATRLREVLASSPTP
jgi:hypothetical protein